MIQFVADSKHEAEEHAEDDCFMSSIRIAIGMTDKANQFPFLVFESVSVRNHDSIPFHSFLIAAVRHAKTSQMFEKQVTRVVIPPESIECNDFITASLRNV